MTNNTPSPNQPESADPTVVIRGQSGHGVLVSPAGGNIAIVAGDIEKSGTVVLTLTEARRLAVALYIVTTFVEGDK